VSFGSGSLKRRSWEGSKLQSEESVEKKEEVVVVTPSKKGLAPQPKPIERIASKSSFKEIIIETENEDKEEEPKKKEKEEEPKKKDKEKDGIFSRKLKNLKKGIFLKSLLIFFSNHYFL